MFLFRKLVLRNWEHFWTNKSEDDIKTQVTKTSVPETVTLRMALECRTQNVLFIAHSDLKIKPMDSGRMLSVGLTDDREMSVLLNEQAEIMLSADTEDVVKPSDRKVSK